MTEDGKRVTQMTLKNHPVLAIIIGKLTDVYKGNSHALQDPKKLTITLIELGWLFNRHLVEGESSEVLDKKLTDLVMWLEENE